MALVSGQVIRMAQMVRKAYLAAEERDAQAAASRAGRRPAVNVRVPDDTRSPVAMQMAPASFLAQFGSEQD